jgi:hypothetical protein
MEVVVVQAQPRGLPLSQRQQPSRGTNPTGSHARAQGSSVAATNPPRDRATPTVLLYNGDVPAARVVSAIAPFFTRCITAALLVCLTLTQTLTTLLLRVAHAELRTTIGTNAELKLRLSNRGCRCEEGLANRGSS